MALQAPQDFEIDDSEEQHLTHHSLDENDDAHTEHSDLSAISELDPLKPDTDSYANGNGSTHKPAWLDHNRRRSKWLASCLPSRFSISLVALFSVTLFLLLAAGGFWAYKHRRQWHFEDDYGLSEPWYPTPAGGQDLAWQESYRKAAELVGQMTLVEKVNITTGTGWSMGMCVGNTGPVERLGFPSLCLQDGPLGLRFVKNITAFPAGITVGATWNKRLMRLRGEALGFEAKMKGVNVLLGPTMGPIGRLPAGGRNWEGFGADPVLQGIAAAETIKGIQSQGAIATAKHWVGNEQEHFRQVGEWGIPDVLSSNIDDRTLHEIYAWPFADSVRAGVGSVMCSYNKVNNSFACQNSKLMNGLLKDELGFQGFVQSDWLAQRSGVASALSGLDMSMPGDGLGWQDGKSLWGSELTKAVLNTSVPIERFNDMALRIVASWYQMGQDNKTTWPHIEDGGGPNFSSWTDEERGKLHEGSPDSYDIGVVNKNVPVRVTDDGGNHDALSRRIAAEGIVLVKNDRKILPLKRDGSNFRRQSQGKVKVGIFGEDAQLNPAGINSCADRSCNVGTLASGWGSGAVEFPYISEPLASIRSAFDANQVEVTSVASNNASDLAEVAAQQDLCLVLVNSDSGEGYLRWEDVQADRPDLLLQKGGDKLVQQVANTCGDSPDVHTIVVIHTVGPVVVESWIDKVQAALIAHLPGQESGNALADVLFGYINPSGRLPYAIAKDEEDYGPTSRILMEQNHPTPQQDFSEGLYFDYRYFDKHNIEPRFAFGYGLSYTTFGISTVKLTHTGVNGTAPRAREYYEVKPPKLGYDLPDPQDSVWPDNMRRLSKYIYPYIESVKDIKVGAYPWPVGYERWHVPSAAGGGQGGNPDLYAVVVDLSISLRNTGSVAGDCVVQVYVSLPADITDTAGQPLDTPVRVLRAFEKRTLEASGSSASADVALQLTRRDLSYWDVVAQNWIMPLGIYNICVGFSSRDLPICKPWEHKITYPPRNGTMSTNTTAHTNATAQHGGRSWPHAVLHGAFRHQ